jgi:hypothetical protein
MLISNIPLSSLDLVLFNPGGRLIQHKGPILKDLLKLRLNKLERLSLKNILTWYIFSSEDINVGWYNLNQFSK